MCLPGTPLSPSLSFYFFSWASLSVFPISINIFLNWFSRMKHVHGLLQWLVACVLVSSTRTHWCVGVTFKLSLPVSSEQRVLIVSPGSVSIADWPSVCKEPLSLSWRNPRHTLHTLQPESHATLWGLRKTPLQAKDPGLRHLLATSGTPYVTMRCYPTSVRRPF